MTASLHDQADEIDLHVLGLRDAAVRAIRRSPEWLERMKGRIVDAEAAAKTLRRLAEREDRPAQAREARP